MNFRLWNLFHTTEQPAKILPVAPEGTHERSKQPSHHYHRVPPTTPPLLVHQPPQATHLVKLATHERGQLGIAPTMPPHILIMGEPTAVSLPFVATRQEAHGVVDTGQPQTQASGRGKRFSRR